MAGRDPTDREMDRWLTGGGDGNYDEAAGARAERELERLQDEAMIRALEVLVKRAGDEVGEATVFACGFKDLDEDERLTLADALRQVAEELQQRRDALWEQVKGRRRSGYYQGYGEG